MCNPLTRCRPGSSAWVIPVWEAGSPTVWGRKMRTCPGSSCCRMRAAAHSAQRTTGNRASCLQGTPFLAGDNPIVDLKRPAGVTADQQRLRLDMLAKLNEIHADRYPGSSELAGRISSYELAYRMQGCAPEAVDINRESDATKKLYGLDEEITAPFGKQCLMA